jgi:hypothetical protein
MRVSRFLPIGHRLLPTICVFLLLHPLLRGQASYQGQIRGVVTDATGAVLANATVTITEVDTNVSQTAKSDGSGDYILRALRPSTYIVKVEAPGFQTVERKGVVLAVGQETSLNFTLRPAGTSTNIQVTEAVPLLDTDSSALGTDITSQYVKEIPLLNRNFFGLVFLNAGVSEAAGSGTADNYPSGTNFVSNGQRVDQRPGTGRGWQLERVLRTLRGSRAGVQSAKQQLLGGIWQQRRHRREHGLEERHQRSSRQRLVVWTAGFPRCQ